MYVSARMGPREVMELYSEYRRDILDEDTRVRDISERTAQLAEFIVAANDGRSWSAAMSAWNRDHEARGGYASTRLFARDCRAAYTKVMGTELGWHGAQQGEAEPPGLQPSQETFAEITRQTWESVRSRQRRLEERKRRRRAERAVQPKEEEEQ
jgi:hypothetical protein